MDGGSGPEGEEVLGLVRNYSFPAGRKEVRANSENRGAVAAWRDAWSWRDREMFILVEDDAELSKHWSDPTQNWGTSIQPGAAGTAGW